MPAQSNNTNEFINDSPYTQQSSDEEDFVGEINRNYMLPNNATQLIVNNEQITEGFDKIPSQWLLKCYNR